MIVSTNEQRSLGFRLADADRVMRALLDHQACALLGVSGAGKTGFLHHISSEPIRRHFLGAQFQRFVFLLLDPCELDPTPLAYFRQMTLLLQGLLPNHLSTLKPFLEPRSEETMRQALFSSAQLLSQLHPSLVVVFCFDDFELVLSQFGARFLEILQALRLHSSRQISYLVTASNRPEVLSDESGTCSLVSEHFHALFGKNIWGLRPFEIHEAEALLAHRLPELALVTTGSLEDLGQLLLTLTGSHPALLQSLITTLAEGNIVLHGQESRSQLLRKLLNDPTIRNRCHQLWQSLSDVEHVCLNLLQQEHLSRAQVCRLLPEPTTNAALAALTLKGICFTEDGMWYRCFSPLLAAAITHLFAPDMRGIQLDPATRHVYIDGKLVSRRLSKKEMQLLELLASEPGRVFRREEITWAIYGEKHAPHRDDERLDALVERSRRHIGDKPRNSRFLETIRGVGHRLNEYLGHRPSS